MFAIVRDAVVGKERFHNTDGLDDTLVTYTRWIQRNAALLIVLRPRARPDAQLETPITEQVERCSFLRQDRRMTEIVVEHQRSKTQRSGRLRGNPERDQWRELR